MPGLVPAPRDRPEEEIAGYRQALDLVHSQADRLTVAPESLLRLHKLDYYGASSVLPGLARRRPRPAAVARLGPLDRAAGWREFEDRAGQVSSPLGAKAELVTHAARRQAGEFTLADIQRACPGVGRDWIRSVLADLRGKGQVSCSGRGPGARWRYLGE